MTPNFLIVFRLLILTLFALPIGIYICVCIRAKHYSESTFAVDAIGSMLHDYCYKYSPFILSLFAKARVEVNEGLEFTTGPTNGRFESIKMDVKVDGGAYPRIEFEVDGVVGLLIPSMKFCQHFKILHMACPSIDFKGTNTSSFYKTTLSNPSSFDAPIFNFCNVSHNLSFKVSFGNSDSR